MQRKSGLLATGLLLVLVLGTLPLEAAGEFDERAASLPNGDFQAGVAHWVATGAITPVPADGIVRLTPGASLQRQVKVERGGVEHQGRQCLVRVKARLSDESAWLRLRIRCGADYRDAVLRVGEGWDTLIAMLTTPPFLPGSADVQLSIELNAGGDGFVEIDEVTLSTAAPYGVMLRATALTPKPVPLALQIIRTHRDTNHRDPVRHQYFSQIPQVKAGTWLDLRRYLFGHGQATVSLRVDDDAAKGSPVRLRLEIGLPAPTPPPRAGRNPTSALLDGPAEDFSLEEPAPTLPRVIWTGEMTCDRGVATLLLPENGVPPERFTQRIQTVSDNIAQRLAWVNAAYPSDGPLPIRIPVAANISALDDLLNRAELEQEMQLLRRIGISAAPRALDSALQAAFDAVRQPDFAGRNFADRFYARLSDEDLISPYEGDALRQRLDAKYARLAQSLHAADAARHLALVELMDEPPNFAVTARDAPAFRQYLQELGVTPEQVGAADWEQVQPWRGGSAALPPLPEDAPDVPEAADLTAPERTPAPDIQLEAAPAPSAADAAPTLDPQALTSRRLQYYTRCFAARRTADIFRTATEVVQTHLPQVRTSVNFRAGIRRVLLPETADWFELGRRRSVTMLWNEDWLNTYGWRHHGIESVGYYTQLMRAAARPHDLPHGCFVIVMGHTLEKAYSALAHGARRISFWRYGPAYANYLPYSWSHSPAAVRDIATFTRDVAALEHLLVEAQPHPPAIALLYAKADALWGRSQAENLLVGFALLHEQKPWEIITETQVEEDAALQRYRMVYITDTSVRRAAQTALAQWVRAGGAVWLSGEAATRDEFNEPCLILRDALAASGARHHLAQGRPGERYAAPVREQFNRERGKGRIQSGWPAAVRREITAFAPDDPATRPVAVDTPGVEAHLYRHAHTDLVFLIDYTGAGVPQDVKVTLRWRPDFGQVTSLRRGPLTLDHTPGAPQLSLLLDRTDVLMIQHAPTGSP